VRQFQNNLKLNNIWRPKYTFLYLPFPQIWVSVFSFFISFVLFPDRATLYFPVSWSSKRTTVVMRLFLHENYHYHMFWEAYLAHTWEKWRNLSCEITRFKAIRGGDLSQNFRFFSFLHILMTCIWGFRIQKFWSIADISCRGMILPLLVQIIYKVPKSGPYYPKLGIFKT